MPIVWTQPKHQGRPAGYVGAISYSLNKSGISTKTKQQQFQFVVRISAQLMKEMRWVIGDRVQLGYDTENKQFILKRDASGYALTSLSGREKHAKGACEAARVQIKQPAFIPRDIPSKSFDIEQCTIDGLYLIFPAPQAEHIRSIA
jgi:hypothetical protein